MWGRQTSETFDLNSDSDASLSDSEDEELMEELGNTKIGTTLYVSPEMLKYQKACFASDLWALGCVIYECLVGKPPFLGKSKAQVEAKISRGEFEFPRKFNKHAKDLIKRLLTVIPYERLGAGDDTSNNSLKELKEHPFFKGKNFERRNKKVPSIRTLKSGVNMDSYDLYDDVYTNEENVSDDESTSESVRSMCFKSIKKVRRSSRKIVRNSNNGSTEQSCSVKSKFFRPQHI